ncbi:MULTISPECIES: response regulator [Aureimonas]|nr:MULTISPECIES: response regulator [Aureimonas]
MPLRILIVEDEALIALELQGILEDAGHDVVAMARSMREALSHAHAHPKLDLAVMDVDLAGGSSGIETAKRLRETYDLTSLFVSGHVDDETRALALEWGPLGFIGKPFAEKQILKAIAHLTIPATR